MLMSLADSIDASTYDSWKLCATFPKIQPVCKCHLNFPHACTDEKEAEMLQVATGKSSITGGPSLVGELIINTRGFLLHNP